MNLVKYATIIQALGLYRGYMTETATPLTNTTTHLDYYIAGASPYVKVLTGRCAWTLENRNGFAVLLTPALRDRIATEVCSSLDCGEVHDISESQAASGHRCFNHCSLSNLSLTSCSMVEADDCRNISKVVCGHQAVRLVGAKHNCSGRLELWQAGEWGTVCDDMWDLNDANVVCGQLDCGYAISVTGQDGPFSQGRGRILLDDLNCTGTERNLWDCSAQTAANDCGHKEDAGVVCSEFKGIRLMGGLDRCSGRVEIHRNGTWGTVCDSCWGKEEAQMACAMLDCGVARSFNQFPEPFLHNNGTKWFYICSDDHRDLWDCRELANVVTVCSGSKAAGLVCSNSAGLPLSATLKYSTAVFHSRGSDPVTTATLSQDGGVAPFTLSPEVLACVALSAALLIALSINVVLCWRGRKKDVLLIAQRNRQRGLEASQENEYRQNVSLVTAVSKGNGADEYGVAKTLPYYQSSADSSMSYDGDCEGSFPLSTFRNSQRYCAERQMLASSHMDRLTEEGSSGDVGHFGTSRNTGKNRSSLDSVDSFETSSTSSGECYENTGDKLSHLLTTDCDQCTDHFLSQTGYQHAYVQTPGTTLSQGREDSPVYGPVSDEDSSECDYDDIANYRN
ncbi:T-cell differentiation antigen CD6-like isoform X2 [Denticeps clupeoides]|uniref:T-cell differentiation antigen CD6-like isoform X2 n=1 Tax=Denticeps clupeoides TaxID=299321 RepID=UPI0010A53678|nr:T-cell differentiation antigen CD6-like isoform X2 [Denticeps clupeoides]